LEVPAARIRTRNGAIRDEIPGLSNGRAEILQPLLRRRGIVSGTGGRRMSTSKKPLKPDDFPVNADGQKIKKQDGTPIADAEDPAVAADVAERLNDDEARREEDKWSA
jgi:hypothetical protein